MHYYKKLHQVPFKYILCALYILANYKEKTDLLLHRKLPRIVWGFGVVISKQMESFIRDVLHFFLMFFSQCNEHDMKFLL